jgi:nitroreductase
VPELPEIVRRRRMTRAFDKRPVPPELITELVDLGSRAPSAGKTQGWHLIVLEGPETARFWDITLPPMRRGKFRWKRLLDAPVIAIPLADPRAYVQRYSEADKQATGLGAGPEAWPVPYWTVDASMSVMTMLLAAEHLGLGALFFGIFRGERQLRRTLGIPGWMQILGALAIGYAAPPDPTPPGGEEASAFGPGRSAPRRRRTPEEIIHRGGWRAPGDRPGTTTNPGAGTTTSG